jgi:hypothetical protein
MVIALVSLYLRTTRARLTLIIQLAHITFATCAINGIYWGTGRHMDALSDEQKFKAMRVCDLANIIFKS